jgi:hypothetical protein
LGIWELGFAIDIHCVAALLLLDGSLIGLVGYCQLYWENVVALLVGLQTPRVARLLVCAGYRAEIAFR